MDNKQFAELLKTLDTTNGLLREMLKPEPAIKRIIDIAASVIGIISAIAIVDIIRVWLGG